MNGLWTFETAAVVQCCFESPLDHQHPLVFRTRHCHLKRRGRFGASSTSRSSADSPEDSCSPKVETWLNDASGFMMSTAAVQSLPDMNNRLHLHFPCWRNQLWLWHEESCSRWCSMLETHRTGSSKDTQQECSLQEHLVLTAFLAMSFKESNDLDYFWAKNEEITNKNVKGPKNTNL